MVLLPAFQRSGKAAARRGRLDSFQRARKSRVILLIHRQETVSFLGMPLARYIDIEDSEDVLRANCMTPTEMPIDLIVHTPGGLVLAAEQIAHALLRHQAPVTMADLARKALAQVRGAVVAILTVGGMDPARADALAEALATGTVTHDYPITFERARALGLPVSDEFPNEVHDLMSQYGMPANRRPSVMYVPLPSADGRPPQ